MMLLLLLLFSIVKGYFGISCIYSEESFEWSLDEFDHDEFKIYIDQFESDDYNENNEDKCRVEIFMDYKNRSVTISLGDSFPWSQLDDGEGRLDYLIMFNQNNTEADIYNVLEYACYDQNECNKLFVLGHIHWLTQMNYSLFETHLRSLLLDHINKTENCFIDKEKTSKCPSGVCSGKFTSSHKNYFFECHQNSEALIEVHITTSMIINEENVPNENNIAEHQIIRYTCKSNQCNNQLLTNQLIFIVNEYFDLSSMKDTLIHYYEEHRTNQTSVSLISSSVQTTTRKEKHESSSSISDFSEDIVKKWFYILIDLILTLLIVFI